MSHTMMTIPGIYDYSKNFLNINIFSGLTVPTDIDRDELINWILHRSAPFEVTYPNPYYLQAAIGTWSKVHARTFQKWVDALNIAYDPLNNYDRTEEMQESGLESRNRVHDNNIVDNNVVNDSELESTSGITNSTGKNNSNMVGSSSDTTDTDTTTTGSVSAFDSSGWSNKDKTVVDSNTTTNGSNIQSTSGSDSNDTTTNDSRFNSRNSMGDRKTSDSGEDNESALNTRQHKLRAFGNIGVTTSQQMLQSELEIDAWNVYEHIVDLFLDEFCVLLY